MTRGELATVINATVTTARVPRETSTKNPDGKRRRGERSNVPGGNSCKDTQVHTHLCGPRGLSSPAADWSGVDRHAWSVILLGWMTRPRNQRVLLTALPSSSCTVVGRSDIDDLRLLEPFSPNYPRLSCRSIHGTWMQIKDGPLVRQA